MKAEKNVRHRSIRTDDELLFWKQVEMEEDETDLGEGGRTRRKVDQVGYASKVR